MLWNQSESNMLVAGHRGLMSRYPENTMVSYQAALDAGVDMIEMDIQMTSDGHLVLIHDHTLERTTNGVGRVKDHTLAELRQLDAGVKLDERFRDLKIPTFREFLDLMSHHPQVMINFELKEYPLEGNEERAFATADQVVACIEEYGLAGRSILNAFSAILLQYIDDKYNHKYKLHGFYPLEKMGRIDRDPYTYLYCACVYDLRRETFDMLKGKGVDTWVCPHPKTIEELRQASQCGATLITCNNPDEILEMLRSMGLHK